MASTVAGTFSATGQSATFALHKGRYAFSFGTGTVVLERKLEADGTWIAARTFTADEVGNLDGGGFHYRLNCTDYTADIKYEIHTGF